jgi:phosphate transport system protein
MTRQHYQKELDAVRQNLVRMGDTTIELLNEAARTISGNADSPARASELEAKTDHQHRTIHDQCFSLITLQAPVARDARLITGTLDAIVDLELIGDYAYEIVTLSASMRHRPPTLILNQITDLSNKIRDTLASAIDGWRGTNGAQPVSARPVEASIRAECQALSDKLTRLLASPVDGTPYATLLIMLKHYERILRHAVCVAEQAIAVAA